MLNLKKKLKDKIPPKKYEALADNLDVLLVAFSLAFAVRALFLQPFKIPTSSMQPTLHGVNIYNDNRNDKRAFIRDTNLTQVDYFRDELGFPAAGGKSSFRNFLDALYYGQTYDDVKSQGNGIAERSDVSIKEVTSNWYGFPLLQSFSKLYIEGKAHVLPVPYHKLDREYKSLNETWDTPFKHAYSKGDTVFKGICEDGDHLFVNRVIYNFRNPARGDIAVFMTKGIRYNGGELNGQFYIKRLVAIPGDTLRIKRDDQSYLVDKNGKEVPLSKEHHKAFEKIFGGKNGYHGHWMARFELRNGVKKEKMFIDFVQVIDSSISSTKEMISLYYNGKSYTKDGAKFTSDDPNSYFTIDKESATYHDDNEKRVFIKYPNSQSWGLKSIFRKDGYEVHFEDDYEEYKLGDRKSVV